MTSLPRVSFIVPVRNDARRLARCLSSIAANAYPPDLIDILVVDNGSTDGSDRVAERFGALLRVEGSTVAELRNAGARAARGDVLAFVDADHEIGAGWIRSAVERLEHHRIAAVGALCQAPPDGTWVQQAYGRLRARRPGCYEVEWLGSGNLAVRRSAFDAVGGFDASLATCEDVDLCQRLRRRGFLILNDNRLRSVHLGDPATLKDLVSGELWRGRDNLRVSLRGPMTWRSLPSMVAPLAVLTALAVIGAGVLTPGGAWMAGLALPAALIPAFARTVRAAHRHRIRSVPVVARMAIVAACYEAARALALVARAPHRTHRQRESAPIEVRPLAVIPSRRMERAA